MGDLKEILDLVEKAGAGSRELDARMHVALFDPEIMTDTGDYKGNGVKWEKASVWVPKWKGDWEAFASMVEAPPYTTSLLRS